MAVKQRAAAQAMAQAEETLKRVQESRDNANGACVKRGPGRLPKAAPCLEPVVQDVETARPAHPRRAGQRETVTQSLRAMGHAYHFVDLARGGRRNGKRIAGDIQHHIDPIRTMAQQEGLRASCMERSETAERVVPTMQATSAFVSGYGRQQVRHLDLPQPPSYAMHVHLMPSYYLERVASTQTVTQGEPLRALAERLRTPLCEPGGALSGLSLMPQDHLQHKAKRLAEVFQRSSANVEGPHGSLALRTSHLRGLDHPRKRACLTALHNFFLTRADGTTAAERFVGQKPRSMFAAILASIEIPPAPLSPPQRAMGSA
jgi:hypothetical protein